MTASDRVMIFDVDAGRAATIAGHLEDVGLTTGHWNQPTGAAEALRRDRPALAVVVEVGGNTATFPDLIAAAHEHEVPTLAVVEPGNDPLGLARRVEGYGGWVARTAAGRELSARAVGLLGRKPGDGKKPAPADLPLIDPRFLALVIHDLRTPLNVIGLTIRTIEHSAPQRNAEFDEDLTFLHENARQIERMLTQLADYCRLIEGESSISGVEFDPRRFLADFLEDRQGRSATEATPVRLEVSDDCPPEVTLDPTRVRLAMQYALANAVAASGESPIRVRSGGEADRWIIEVVVNKPPPPTVVSVELRADKFERLTGSPAERRGLDLAIVARVSDLFGGFARLDIEPGRRSSIVLDWPVRLAKS